MTYQRSPLVARIRAKQIGTERPYATTDLDEADVSSVVTPAAAAALVDQKRPFATEQQAAEGVEAGRVTSPATVRAAVSAQRPFATSAEAVAGAEAAKVVSPATLKAAVNSHVIRGSVVADLDFGTIDAGLGAVVSVSVPGAQVGDVAAVGWPAPYPPGLVETCWVSGAGEISVRLVNVTASSIAVGILNGTRLSYTRP